MSYAPVFAPDARSQWRALEVRFQEVAPDELDRLCLSPPKESEHVADVVVEGATVRHFVFVHVFVDHARRTVTAVGVGHTTRARHG